MPNRWLKPKPGDEWKPKFPVREVGPVKPVENFGDVWDKMVEGFPHRDPPCSPRYVNRIDRSREDEGTTRVEGIIIDPLAFYVPYHSFPKDYGIYFRVKRMRPDLQTYLSSCVLLLKPPNIAELMLCAFKVYLGTVYGHELCHHVVEDDTSLLEHFGLCKYPSLQDRYEEPFCEYNAFDSIEKRSSELSERESPLYHVTKDIKSILHLGRVFMKPYLRDVLTILYYHWNRHQIALYRPYVDSVVIKTISPTWWALWRHHWRSLTLTKVPKEVFNHVYWASL